MIEDLESNLNGKTIDASNLEDLAVAEEANYDEAITALDKAINGM